MDSEKKKNRRHKDTEAKNIVRDALRIGAVAPLRFLFVTVAAIGSPSILAAQEATPDFPANSVEPRPEIAPANGLPAYDGDTTSVRRDMVASPPHADEDDNEPVKKKEHPLLKALRDGFTQTEVGGTAEWRAPVSMRDGASGRMGAWAYGGEASLRHISEDFTGVLDFEYKRTDFAFTGPAPWDDTDMYRISGHIEAPVAGNWGVFANGGLRMGAEKDVSPADGFTAYAGAGGRYRFTPEFAFYFGALATTRLDNDPLIFPIVAFDFRMGKWSVMTINGVVVGYDVNSDNSLMLEASTRFDTSDFRLSPEPGTGRSRSVEFQEVPFSLSATKRLGEHAFVKLHATVIIWSDYRLRTARATSGDFQTSPGPVFGLSAGARF